MARGGPRPGAGRRPKEPALKALAGTTRADREKAVGAPAPPGSMIAPMHLGDLEQLLFGSIVGLLEEQRRASPHWTEHVALLAIRLAQVQRLKSVLEMEGDTYHANTANGFIIRARPEVAMLSDAMRQAQSLLGELMLNPSAALRIAEGHKPEAGDFDDF